MLKGNPEIALLFQWRTETPKIWSKTSANGNHSTYIVSVKWRAYAAAFRVLKKFTHGTINYSLNFVEPDNPLIHAQDFEGNWTRCNFFAKEKGYVSRRTIVEFFLFIWNYSTEKRQRLNYVSLLMRIDQIFK